MLRDLFSLFPAYAGVILESSLSTQSAPSFPRICGGDPDSYSFTTTAPTFSPHMRG